MISSIFSEEVIPLPPFRLEAESLEEADSVFVVCDGTRVHLVDFFLPCGIEDTFHHGILQAGPREVSVEVGAEIACSPSLGMGVFIYADEPDYLIGVLRGELYQGGGFQPLFDPLPFVGSHAPSQGLIGHEGEHGEEPVRVPGGKGDEVYGSSVF